MDRRMFKPGERLFVEGDEHSLLVVVGKGHMVGEMALIDDAPRMPTARATEETVALVVPQEEFDKRRERTDPVGCLLLGILARRLRQQTARATERQTVVR